jgi:hypothetical protein
MDENNAKGFVLGYETGQAAERQEIINLIKNYIKDTGLGYLHKSALKILIEDIEARNK